MTREQDGDEQAKQEGQAAMGALGPPKNVEDVCSSCGGGVLTVVLGGTDRPQFQVRLGSNGGRLMGLDDDGGCNPAHTALRHEVCGAGQGTVFGRPKITVICGGCGTSLIRFEAEAHD